MKISHGAPEIYTGVQLALWGIFSWKHFHDLTLEIMCSVRGLHQVGMAEIRLVHEVERS
jgi:hypothetical protein